VRASKGVIANGYEWSLLCEKTGLDVDGLLGETSMLIVTQGEAGLTIYTPGETIVLQGCLAEKVVNPTGAGDALRAGFLTGMAHGWTLRQCGMLGASMGSFAVEQEGTLLDFLDLNGVLGRAETTYREVLPELK
jgi:adenosine kinase